MVKNQFEWLLVGSQLLAQLADKMMSLGLIWYITTQFGENWLTWYLVVGGMPHLIFASFSGKIIQKIGALKTVIFADILRALLFGAGAYIFFNFENAKPLYFIIGLVFTSNIFSAFFNPAILTLPLELEDGSRVQLLTARLTTITSLTTVIGPILGLFCFNHFGLNGLLLITFISYGVSGGCAFKIRNRFSVKATTPGENIDNELGSAETVPLENSNFEAKSVTIISSLKRNQLISVMLAVFLFMNLFLSPLQVLMPSMAKNLFRGSFNSLAYMEMVFGIGIVMGGVLLSLFSINKKELLWVWGLLVIFSLSYLFLHFQEGLPLTLIFLLFMGISLGLMNVLIIHIFQEKPSNKDVPNIMSITNLISTASVPFSLTGLALLQHFLSVERLALLSSAGLVIVVLLAYYPFEKWGKELFK